MGQCLARLGIALQGFEYPSSNYNLLWDIKRACSLKKLLQHVGDKSLRDGCTGLLAHFESSVRPALDDMRWQFIHNDLNPGNVLVASELPDTLAEVIDFGDAVRSPLIIDVAVASAYLCRPDDGPFVDVVPFLAAYPAELPLQQQEIEVLRDLILMRCILTILIANLRAVQFPENRKYILRSEKLARNTFAKIDALPRQSITEQFLDACDC